MMVLGMERWFVIGLIALILFFAVIVASLLGFIPQDRLPIQSALVIMTFIIAALAFIGHQLDDSIGQIGWIDLEGMIIIHPITALAAGFLDALLDGHSLDQAGDRGVEWAARACRYLGARAWLDQEPPDYRAS